MYINNLITGTMTIGSGGSTPAARTATRVWYGNDENVYTDYEFSGDIQGTESQDGPPGAAIEQHAKKVDIGTNVTGIGQYAFFNCSQMTSITIPSSVLTIGEMAFYNCGSLASVTIPDSVTSIGQDAFGGCYSLTSVVFQGKTFEQVQEMNNYPWEISDTSIITVA